LALNSASILSISETASQVFVFLGIFRPDVKPLCYLPPGKVSFCLYVLGTAF